MIVDFDDFGQHNHKLDLLQGLKEANSSFRCTLFAIPAQCPPEFLAQVPDWCEIAVHGADHGDPATDGGECKDWSYTQMVALIDEIEQEQRVGGRWVRGFKAPGWQISDGCFDALVDRGWWVADQPYNDDRRPLGLRVHRLGDFDHWHQHIQDVCGNGLAESFSTIVAAVRAAEVFHFVSEVARPW